MLKTYALNIKAQASEEYSFVGDYLRVKASRSPLIIEINGKERFELSEGEDVNCGDFKSLIITNTDTSDQTIKLAVGSNGASIRSSRVSGEVSVISGELATVKAGKAFMGVAGLPALAGNYTHMQLANPAGSGKNIIVKRLSVITNGSVSLSSYDTLLTTSQGNGVSKLLGGVASVAQMRVQQNTSLMYGAILANLQVIGGGESKEFELVEPIVLIPGKALLTYCSAIGAGGYVTFQWNQEDI